MGTSDGAVVGTTLLADNGPASARWNLVILGDGYQQAQLGQFAIDAQSFVTTFLATAPFDSLRRAVNVYRVDVASTDSGADDPASCGGTGAVRRTYFDAAFCNNGIRRLLVVNASTALSVASAQVPQWSMVMVIVNSTVYGGSGGAVAAFSLAGGANEIGLHEMGHTAFGFADEYESYQGCGSGETDRNNHPPVEPSQPNVTVNANRATNKWRDLIAPTTPMPTTTNANCAQCDPQPNPLAAGTVGAFEGAHFYHCGAYRPQFDCRMRALGFPFCAVCQRQIRLTLQPFLPKPVATPPSRRGPVAPSADGRLELMALGRDGSLWAQWQTAPSNGWSPWGSHGQPAGVVLEGSPMLAPSADGRLEMFVVGGDGNLWAKWQTAPSNGWSAWASHGQPAGVGLTGSPRLAPSADGRLELVVVGSDGNLWSKWQTSAANGWSDWGSHGQPPGVNLTGTAMVAASADGRLELLVVGSDGNLWARWQTAPSNGWSDWGSHGQPPGVHLTGSPMLAASADGRLELLVVGRDGNLWAQWQTAPSNGWSGWGSHGQPPGVDLAPVARP